jgi:hypothetical protein
MFSKYGFLLIILVSLGLFACNPSIERQAEKVLSFFQKHKYGSSPDYAVVKLNFAGEREHVVVVYGFMDDFGVCIKLVAKLNEEEPNKYTCEQLNF